MSVAHYSSCLLARDLLPVTSPQHSIAIARENSESDVRVNRAAASVIR